MIEFAPLPALGRNRHLAFFALGKVEVVRRVQNPHCGTNRADFSQFEFGVVDEQNAVDADVELLGDGFDALAFWLPGNLRAKEIVVQPEFLNHLQRVFRIVLAGDGVQDAALIQLANDLGDAGLQAAAGPDRPPPALHPTRCCRGPTQCI